MREGLARDRQTPRALISADRGFRIGADHAIGALGVKTLRGSDALAVPYGRPAAKPLASGWKIALNWAAAAQAVGQVANAEAVKL